MTEKVIRIVDVVKDGRVDCVSCVAIMSIGDYLDLVSEAYNNKGGIEGQREALTTATAVRIRNRMIQDIQRGAILPPIVLGSLTKDISNIRLDDINTSNFIRHISEDTISIIDGMQRTTSLIQAAHNQPEIRSNPIRIEFWLADNSNSLLYRMLVLNTGQVPWNLKRQVEVVFRSMTDEIRSNCPNVELLSQKRRRWSGGQFQSDSAIEMYLAFGSRKENIDTKEKLTDEFVRLDFIEATSEKEFTWQFFAFFDLMSMIDKNFDRFNMTKPKNEGEYAKFSIGRDLFSSQPACIGFAAASAEKIFGRPGLDKSKSDSDAEFARIIFNMRSLKDRLDTLDPEGIRDFLDFTTLNQTVAVRSSRTSVGEHERAFFKNAFKVLIDENFNIPSLTACWRV
ncbi:hypothetical protein [Deinococcus daejeonensis]|uniref:DUF262 domain-containing protein n=1 Tax=Deinococcus daejeonensis TaxID=1007098 RepID=A0ABQ2J9L3_9DEIO|nr:hypothetical protein [Deinococcus daejeonensis]GGN40616.1 hypothetical protein GCM10010842_25660 [Deinococcus daejeonensis]